MIPGITTKISEQIIALTTTIRPEADLVRVTSTASTTVVATIIPAFSGQSGIMLFVNQSGASLTTVTSGNIQTAITVADAALVVMAYSHQTSKWIVGALL